MHRALFITALLKIDFFSLHSKALFEKLSKVSLSGRHCHEE
jgi:hypothetical protein